MKVVAIIITAFAAFAAARTTPAPGDPTGNPTISPALDQQVEAGKPFEITWTPTLGKDSTISLILLRGPSTNVKPIQTIVEGVPNNGKYTWNVPSTLENDKTHYGIQLIVDSTGQYQYTPQFGVSNPDYVPTSGGSAPSKTEELAVDTVAPQTTAPASAEETVSLISGTGGSYGDITSLMASISAAETAYPTTVVPSVAPTAVSPAKNETEEKPSAPSAPVPEQTGAASSVRVGLSMLVGAVVVAAAL